MMKCIFIALIALFSLSVSIQAQPAGPNLLVNGGAESGDLTGWSVWTTTDSNYPNPRLLVDGTDAIPSPANHSGSHRFSVQMSYEFVAFFQYQTIDVIPGHIYELGFWTTQVDGTTQYVTMYWYDGQTIPGLRAEEFPLPNLETIAPYATITGSDYDEVISTWKHFSGASKRVRPSQNKMTVALYYRHVWQTGICVWHVDDIYCVDVTPNPQPTPTPGGIVPGNLLNNPGAETGDLTSWSWGGNVFPKIDPSVYIPSPSNHSGSHRFGWDTGFVADQKGYMYQVVDTVPGHNYEFGFYMTQREGTDEYLDSYYANNTVNDTWNVLFGAGAGPYPNWIEQKQTFQAASNRTALIIHFKHNWGTGQAVFHVDDIRFVDLDAPVVTPTPTPTATPTQIPAQASFHTW